MKQEQEKQQRDSSGSENLQSIYPAPADIGSAELEVVGSKDSGAETATKPKARFKLILTITIIALLLLALVYITLFKKDLFSKFLNSADKNSSDVSTAQPLVSGIILVNQNEVYTVDTKGENKEVLYTRKKTRDIVNENIAAQGTADFPVLSADNRYLAVQDNSVVPYLLNIVNLDTKKVKEIPLTNLCGEVYNDDTTMKAYSWGKDDKEIIFKCNSGNRLDVLNVATTTLTAVEYSTESDLSETRILGQTKSGSYLFCQQCDSTLLDGLHLGQIDSWRTDQDLKLVEDIGDEQMVAISPNLQRGIVPAPLGVKQVGEYGIPTTIRLDLYDWDTVTKTKELGEFDPSLLMQGGGLKWLNDNQIVISDEKKSELVDLDRGTRKTLTDLAKQQEILSPNAEFGLKFESDPVSSQEELDKARYWYKIENLSVTQSVNYMVEDANTYVVGWLLK